VREYERKQFLERIERDGATVGATIPETITIDDKPVALREFVFEVKQYDALPQDRESEVAELRNGLRKGRQQRKRQLESGDISTQKGQQLVDEIVGIDRALNSLESVGPADIEDEMATAEAADQKRWFDFLKTVLGQDESTKGQTRRRE
jgi:hypothetical protein